jgi:hypothetical protein
MRAPWLLLTVLTVSLSAVGVSAETPFARLPATVLDVLPPSARVRGEPGAMTIRPAPCSRVPAADLGRRIVDVAIQEWGFFGFTVVDHTEAEDDEEDDEARRRARRLSPEQAARVAASIAGYWSVTPSGGWILDHQNTLWNGPRGAGERWRYPWSAAFISWVMCESGLSGAVEFQRAVAHHTYIDQAIRARDQPASRAAYAAYERGEAAVSPGDLLCTSRRPVYRTLGDRRRQMGTGARTHCDIVVNVDPEDGRIFAIGGNVRGSVSLKVLPATAVQAPRGSANATSSARPVFAHLKLRRAASLANAFETSPTLRALGCHGPSGPAPGRDVTCALSRD